ncbi:MAG: hypothetical protein V3S55_02455 [Nitrospiraceae bacterium]
MKTRVFVGPRCVILYFLMTFLFFVPQANADRPNQGNGKAIKDKVQNVLDKTDTLGSNLEALCGFDCQTTPAGQKFKQKVGRLRQAHSRAKNAHGRAKDEDYQELVRKRGKKKNEGCDPQVQVCLPDQSLSMYAAATDPEYDEERGKDMVEDLEEVGEELDELNAILSGHVPPPPPPDIDLEHADYFFPPSMWPSPELMYAAFIADQVAQKVAAISTHGCDQTAVALGFGGNASAACIAVESVYQVLDYAYQLLNYISQTVTSAEVTGTYRRTKNIFDQLAITDGNIDQMKVVVEALGQKMLELEVNQMFIIQLLTTPQGQRPGFPKP